MDKNELAKRLKIEASHNWVGEPVDLENYSTNIFNNQPRSISDFSFPLRTNEWYGDDTLLQKNWCTIYVYVSREYKTIQFYIDYNRDLKDFAKILTFSLDFESNV